MKTVLRITKAEYLDGYRIHVDFNDGSSGIADYTGELTGYLAPLKNKKLFAKVEVDRGALSWPGDFSIDASHTHAVAHHLDAPETFADVERNLLAVRLRDLRTRSGKSQGEVAQAMKIAQPTLAKIESGNDPKVSTVRRYIQALGGRLEIVATIGGKRVALEIPELAHVPARKRSPKTAAKRA